MVGTPHTPYEMGYYARVFGHSLDSNPFEQDFELTEYNEWNTGWLLADTDEDMFLAYGTLDWI